MDWHQLSSGLSNSILQNPNQRFSYVSSIWFNNLHQFMANNKITIVLVNTLQFNIQRRNDKCIMDELTRGSSSISQLIQSNVCRLYLNIIHLNDIISPDGNTINNNFLIGCKPSYPSSKLKWPHQTYPSIKAWKLWNTTLKKVFNIQDNLMLKPFSRLGEWLVPDSQGIWLPNGTIPLVDMS